VKKYDKEKEWTKGTDLFLNITERVI